MHYNLDRAYRAVGEFGRAQWLLTFVNCVARNAGTYTYYPFAYLVLEQKFLCTDPHSELGLETQCSAEKVCDFRSADPSYSAYRVDTGY